MSKNIIPDPTQSGVSMDALSRRPAWSDPALDDLDRGPGTHADDAGIWMKSRPVDQWTVVHEQDGQTFAASDPVRVFVSGFRHDTRPEFDWSDSVHVEGDTDPGGGNNLMKADTARRLAAALVKAADLVEGLAGTDAVVGREACDRRPCDAAYRGGTHAQGLHSVNWMRANECGVEVSADSVEDEPWSTRISIGGQSVDLQAPEVVRLVSALLNANETAADANLADAKAGR